ncbi:DegV family protein [Bacillus suaedaesalsae]|uniref:DegV family protein n=1 Tax=Bacillus suaedaesalsae TaxID=2810349 RepID=A0ABS2DFB1_9BACI|nr:DegV family protein [Bacillus suaedaesalsae]MBM6617101.1 DegV family protein [Bacillus suaedaesalsae]
MSIQLLTDSACDLPREILQEQNIIMFPLVVHLDDTDYYDTETIDSSKVYEAMRMEKVPKTSQVPPTRFQDTFTRLAEEKKEAIYISFSSELSGTYQTAMLMAEQVREQYPDFKLTIINTKCASLGMGLVVLKAAEYAKRGYSYDELVTRTQVHANHMEHIFTVDNLDYLARGGRVSKASAFVGGLLNIKPLLHVEDGKLIPLEKIRGRKKVLQRMLEVMKERGTNFAGQTIGISHGEDEETALYLQEKIKEQLGCETFFISKIGSAVGAHAGPGTIALFFLNKELD